MCENPTTPTTDETEEWLPVVGHEGFYSVSSFGRVRRDAPARNSYAGRILTLNAHRRGYPVVSLSSAGKSANRLVHQLVLEAFVGPRPEGWVVNHIDANRRNNYLSNIEYVTYVENALHTIKIGRGQVGENHWKRKRPELIARGDDHPNTKVTDQMAVDIRAALTNGETVQSVMARFGLSAVTVSRVRNRWGRFSD